MNYFTLLKQRTVLLLWAGQLASVMGDRIYTMTVLWLIMQAGGSAELMAMVAVSQLIPLVIAGVFGGAMVDRFDNVRILIYSDVGRALLVAILPATFAAGLFSTWQLIVVAVGLGILTSFFVPAFQASLPAIAKRSGLPLISLLGLMDTSDRLARIAGPGIAGLLLLVISQVNLLAINALSFIISAVTISLVATDLRVSERDTEIENAAKAKPMLKSIKNGMQWVFNDRAIVIGIIVRGWGNFAFGIYTIGLPFLVPHQFNASFGAYGFLLAVYGVATLVGNLIVGNFNTNQRLVLMFCVAWAIVGLGFLLCGISSSVGLAAAGTFIMGFAVPFANVSMDAYVGRVAPPDMLGRAYAFQRISRDGSNALGLLAGGVFLHEIDAQRAFVMAAISVVVVALVGMVWPTRAAQDCDPKSVVGASANRPSSEGNLDA